MYDATRKRLLRGREDLLGLVAARLKYKEEREQGAQTKPIWVDVRSLGLWQLLRISMILD